MMVGEAKDIAEIFVGMLSILLASLTGWFMWDKKRARESIDSHAERITKLEAEMITERDVKELIVESMLPFREDMKELKLIMHSMSKDTMEMKLELAKQAGYMRAKEESKK